MDLSYTTNLPWSSINAHYGSHEQLNFSGVDMYSFNPSNLFFMYYINFDDTTNFPWAVVNNLPFLTLRRSSFKNVDLTGFAPPPGTDLSFGVYDGAKNIPWNIFNNLSYNITSISFKNLDLRGFDPSGNSILGAFLPLAARSKKGFEIMTRNVPSSGTTFIDGTTPWGP